MCASTPGRELHTNALDPTPVASPEGFFLSWFFSNNVHGYIGRQARFASFS